MWEFSLPYKVSYTRDFMANYLSDTSTLEDSTDAMAVVFSRALRGRSRARATDRIIFQVMLVDRRRDALSSARPSTAS